MGQLPGRAVSLPLIIHRRQYLKTRSSLKLFPDSVKVDVSVFVFGRHVTPLGRWNK